MFSREVVVLLATSLFGTVCSVSKSVKYEGPSGKISNKIGCAAMSTDPSFLAVRIHGENGICQGLTWNGWGSNPTYENGYTYFDKKRTFENPNSLSVPFMADLNAGSLTDGKNIHIEGIPTADPSLFTIYLQGDGSSVADQIALVLSVRFNFASDREVVVRTDRKNGIWGIREDFTPSFPFSPGVPYKITILYQQNTFKVDVNNEHFVDFDARSSPLNHIDTLQIKVDTQLTKVIVKW